MYLNNIIFVLLVGFSLVFCEVSQIMIVQQDLSCDAVKTASNNIDGFSASNVPALKIAGMPDHLA